MYIKMCVCDILLSTYLDDKDFSSQSCERLRKCCNLDNNTCFLKKGESKLKFFQKKYN